MSGIGCEGDVADVGHAGERLTQALGPRLVEHELAEWTSRHRVFTCPRPAGLKADLVLLLRFQPEAIR